ncbi:unnamed protein product, partial [marine sediment metagenome]
TLKLYFSGTHNFIGQNVYVEVLSHKINVGSYYTFTVEMPDIDNDGEYTAYLKLEHDGSIITLDSYSFALTGEEWIPEPEPDIFGLPIEYMHAMFGAFITLGFLLLPLAMAIKSKHETSSVVYAIFGGIGLGISTAAGFFPIWLPFMICIIMIGVVIIEYKKK